MEATVKVSGLCDQEPWDGQRAVAGPQRGCGLPDVRARWGLEGDRPEHVDRNTSAYLTNSSLPQLLPCHLLQEVLMQLTCLRCAGYSYKRGTWLCGKTVDMGHLESLGKS